MKWVSTWKYLPIRYDMELAVMENCTQRVILPNNLNGEKVRVLLTNKWSGNQLTIERMTIGIANGECVINPKPVTLNGSETICLSAGEEKFSDEIDIKVIAGEKIAVSIYIKGKQGIENVSCFWARGGTVVELNKSGDATDGRALDICSAQEYYPMLKTETNPDKTVFFYGFRSVQIMTGDDVKAIEAFGDSITHMSYVTNELTKRLYQKYPGQVAVINCGIGGNRLVHDATFIENAPAKGGLFGNAGVVRFEEDVYDIDKVDTVIALEVSMT